MTWAAVRSQAMVLLLVVRCWLLLTLWGSVIILCFDVPYFVSILAWNHFDGEERFGCFL